MKLKYLPIFVAILVAGSQQVAKACVCSDPVLSDRESAQQQFAEAAMVFEGEVLPGSRTIDAPAPPHFKGLAVIVFRVLRIYKGPDGEQVEIYDAFAGSDCGFGIPLGEKFFVYAFKGKDGKFYLSACTRTAALSQAGPDIRSARGEPATPEDFAPAGERWRLYDDPTLATTGATLRGTVHHFNAEPDGRIFLTVWKADAMGHRLNEIAASQEVNSDESFDVRFLEPGNYVVTAEDSQVTPTLRFVGTFGSLYLVKGQDFCCANFALRPEPLGEIIMKIVAPPELHDRIDVLLRDSRMDYMTGGDPYKYVDTVKLDSQNQAVFKSVPYAMYDVEVVLNDDDAFRPSWTHKKVCIQLNGAHAGATIELHKRDSN